MPYWLDARCSGDDLDRWFPSTDRPEILVELRAVCAQCPVRTACATWAVDNRILWGVWGGTSPEERKSIIRGRLTLDTVWRRFDNRYA